MEWLWFADDDLQFGSRDLSINRRCNRDLNLEGFDALLARLASLMRPPYAMIGLIRRGTYLH